MKIPFYFFLSFYFLIVHFDAYGQKDGYPVIVKSGQDILDFVPSNWEIIGKAEGDLNKDGLTDAVLIVQDTKEEKIIGTHNENLRILFILFKEKDNSGYSLNFQSNTYIPLDNIENMEDRFNSVDIKKGILNFSFLYFCNAGCWEMTSSTYKFRFQNNQFELIGYEDETIHRASGETSRLSINFSTRMMERSFGQMDENGDVSINNSETKLSKFSLKKLKALKELKEPQTWEFLDMIL